VEVIFSVDKQKELQLSTGVTFQLNPPWQPIHIGTSFPVITFTRFSQIEILNRTDIDTQEFLLDYHKQKNFTTLRMDGCEHMVGVTKTVNNEDKMELEESSESENQRTLQKTKQNQSLASLHSYSNCVTFTAIVTDIIPPKDTNIKKIHTQTQLLSSQRLDGRLLSSAPGLVGTASLLLQDRYSKQEGLFKLDIPNSHVHKWLPVIAEGKGRVVVFRDVKVVKKSLLTSSVLDKQISFATPNVLFVLFTTVSKSQFEIQQYEPIQ